MVARPYRLVVRYASAAISGAPQPGDPARSAVAAGAGARRHVCRTRITALPVRGPARGRGPGVRPSGRTLGAREKPEAPQGPETFRKCALRTTTGPDYASLTLAATPTAALFLR